MQNMNIRKQARFALPVAAALLLGVTATPFHAAAADQTAAPPSSFAWSVQLDGGTKAIGGYSASIADAITLAEQGLSPQYYTEVERQITVEGTAMGASSAPSATPTPTATPAPIPGDE